MLILKGSLRRIGVLVKVDVPITTASRKNFSVLWQETTTPHRRLMCLLGHVSITLGWVECSHVIHPESRLQRAHYQLVHLDVLAVKLHPACPIVDVALPSDCVRA